MWILRFTQEFVFDKDLDQVCYLFIVLLAPCFCNVLSLSTAIIVEYINIYIYFGMAVYEAWALHGRNVNLIHLLWNVMMHVISSVNNGGKLGIYLNILGVKARFLPS